MELMVATVISIMVAVVVAGSAQFFNAQAKVSVGTNSVLESLSLGSRAMASSIRMAGFGLSMCPSTNIVNTLDSVDAGLPITQLFAVTAGATDKDSDSITVFFGDSATGVSKSFLSADMAGNQILVGYAGNMVAGGMALVSNAMTCDVYGLTSVANFDANNDQAITGATIKGNHWSSPNLYKKGDTVIGLSSIRNLTYRIVTTANKDYGLLEEFDSISNTTTNIIDGLALMKIYYGLNDGTFVAANTNNSAVVDWTAAGLMASPANRARIKSVRLFLVARSPVYNRKDDAGNCATTAVVPTSWDGGPTVDLTGIPDWQCYRYRTADLIIPLRNISLAANL